jgi:hypothetical protein
MVDEDQRIFIRLMKKHGYRIHETWLSAADRSAWNDYSLMKEIERIKRQTRVQLMRLRLNGNQAGYSADNSR